MTTSTYAPPFLQGAGGPQQALPWLQGTYGQPPQFGLPGFEQFQQYGQGQQSPGQFGQFGPHGMGQQPFGGPFQGSQAPGVDQIVPSIQMIVQLLGHAQQAILTAQHVAAQLPLHLASAQQPYSQQRQFPQIQRPYSMAW